MIKHELFRPEKHYNLVTEWWQRQNFAVVPLSHLPQVGIVVFVNEKPTAAGWLYQTDSSICWLEWIVANPEIRGEERKAALSYLINEVKRAASQMDFKTIFMSVQNASLMSRLESHGFVQSDKDMTNLIFNLQGGS